MAFKMKGPSLLKMYGKSPMKKEMTAEQKVSFADAYKKRDMDLYGGLSLSEFTTEAKRQKSGGKVPKKPMSSTPPKTPKVGTVNTTEGVLKGDKGNFADNKGLTDFSKPKTKAKRKAKKLKDTKVGKEVRKFGQSLREMLTKPKKYTTDPITGKRKKYTPRSKK